MLDLEAESAEATVGGIGLVEPVRLHEAAIDNYSTRFADGVLPEACVSDVLRGEQPRRGR